MSRPIRIGVIGCGSVSQKYIPHLLRLNIPTPRVEIAILCDALETRREEVRQRYNITNFTTDYMQVLNDPDIDAVLVLTSMQFHGKITKDALAASFSARRIRQCGGTFTTVTLAPS